LEHHLHPCLEWLEVLQVTTDVSNKYDFLYPYLIEGRTQMQATIAFNSLIFFGITPERQLLVYFL
jgi:hypothetical protein